MINDRIRDDVDTDLIDDDVDAVPVGAAAYSDKEPATKHDVTEGGVIGAVGGAIVGGLAGGPLGAVIGAVAGGAASAGAVDVVDKHDHDYVQTVAGTNTIAGTSRAAYSDYDSDFRNDYQTRYSSTGIAYDDYDPAYRYGYGLVDDPRYQDGDWDTIEPSARADWEAHRPGTWERFKDSVRYGWDRTKAHL